ncbi:hypothetical protein EDC01DRAFT_635159 [Geopyxis carbonaria]|nr:hypothetical protein EDC01DRAFT_635159 [Geopyxis carbonaria]
MASNSPAQSYGHYGKRDDAEAKRQMLPILHAENQQEWPLENFEIHQHAPSLLPQPEAPRWDHWNVTPDQSVSPPSFHQDPNYQQDNNYLLHDVDLTDISQIQNYGLNSGVEFGPILATATHRGDISSQSYDQGLDTQNFPMVQEGLETRLDYATVRQPTVYDELAPSYLENSFHSHVDNYNTSVSADFGNLTEYNLNDHRGVQLYDNPHTELEDFREDASYPQILSYSSVGLLDQNMPEHIKSFFTQNYASRFPIEQLPALPLEHPNSNGDVVCNFCIPHVAINVSNYRNHKQETHGIDPKTNFYYQAPIEIQCVNGAVGVGYQGYCQSCNKWIALDTSKTDYNWFQHASSCQDHSRTISDPLQRYYHSASEEEAASIHDIAAAASKKRIYVGSRNLLGGSNQTSEGSISWSSASSRSANSGGSSNSNSSLNSALSHNSRASIESRRKKALRFRKRRSNKTATNRNAMYQCTFCMADFTSYGDWRRHEENVHLVLNKWACAPTGKYKPGTKECVYCDAIHENEGINRCNVNYCHAKDPEDRVFARKDHLKQHLKKIHGVQWRDAFDAWSVKNQGPRHSRCGFCNITFDTWHSRMHHVGTEFKNGQRMDDWQGDWGLDATWMAEGKLGDATLPELREGHKLRQHRISSKRSLRRKPAFSIGKGSTASVPQSVYTDNFSEDPPGWTTSMMMPPPQQQLTPPDSHANSDPTTSPIFDVSPASKSAKTDQSIQCWHCKKNFTRQDNLRRHIRKTHEPEHVTSADFVDSQW